MGSVVVDHTWWDWASVAETWSSLHSRSLQRSFFTSSAWVSTWIDVFAADLQPSIHVLEVQGVPRATWILVRRTEKWHGIPMRRVYLDTAGEEDCDSPCVEYNGMVCDPEFYQEAIGAL